MGENKEEKSMELKNVFEKFDKEGKLLLADATIEFANIEWSKHVTFEGVELKHIVTSKETDGKFSYHLVRIAPNKKIGNHVHKEQLETHEVIAGTGNCVVNGKQINYEPGTISILPQNVPHEVTAGKDGLYIFAKFMPALI